LLIARKLWRYKLVTGPIVVLTLLASAYVLVVKKPLYEATSSYLLISPPAPPTPEQIARDPALGRIRTDNPYTRFGDPGVVIDVLSRSMNSESARESLVKAGADSRYMVGSGAQFGSSTPIVQITGTGSSPDGARRTAEVVGHALIGELNRMQRAQGVDSDYRITTLPVESPDTAQLQASGQLRMLVGVLAAGAIVLFIAVSFLDAIAAVVSQRRTPQFEAARDPDDAVFPDLDPFVEPRVASTSHREGTPKVTPARTASARRLP
jgi:hypothetical protein